MTELLTDPDASPPAARAGRRPSRRGRSTRAALIGAAERLIAEQGLGRVSVAQIARAADLRSRAATQYYFKSLEDIALAVLEQRGPGIRARRAAMLEAIEGVGHGHDVRAIVEAVVLPVTGLLGASGAHFRCVAQLNALNPADPLQWLAPEERHDHEQWRKRLHAELTFAPQAQRGRRIDMASDLCTATLARLEAQIEADPTSVSVAQASVALVDAVTAILTGPDRTG